MRQLRKRYNLSQKQLAGLLNVSAQSVCNWENDNIMPSVEMITRIATHFDVSTDYLLGLDNRSFIEVGDLQEAHLAHIQMIVNDIRRGGQ